MFGILGSGYGIYGYAPSVLKMEGKLCLLSKSQELFRTRIETKNYCDQVIWAAHREDLCRQSSALIIAQPPQEQYEIITSLYNSNYKDSVKKLVLEKPLAATPELAQSLLTALDSQNVQLRVGYIFYYLTWFKELEKLIHNRSNSNVALEWFFQAHNLVNNLETWKKYHSKGGGCLRFYGIHIIAVLAHLNFNVVKNSTLYFMADDIPVKWDAEFANECGSVFKVSIDIFAKAKHFTIGVQNCLDIIFEYKAKDVFESKESVYHDVRSDYIEMLLASFNEQDLFFNNWYHKTNTLWSLIEKQSNMEYQG